jgi:predicted transcriptional regulator
MKCKEIVCQRCNGSGLQKMPKRLSPLISLITNKGPLSVRECHELVRSDLDITATNHKISQLVRLRLIKVDGRGRPKKYVIA